MYNHGDYSSYLNLLKIKKTYNNNYTNYANYTNYVNNIPQQNLVIKNNPNFESLFTDKTYYCTPVIINYEKEITYIENPLDINLEEENSITRNYILQADNSIPNGTLKTIVNNININNTSSVTLTTEHDGGFAIFNKRYTKYHFVYAGEDFQLLWNSSLGSWSTLKYSGLFE
jgi:hypothetical protein